MKTKFVIVESKDIGQRLDKWLLQFEEIFSRSYAQDLINKNLVLIDDLPGKSSLQLKIGQKISISIPEVKPMGLVPFDFKLDIIFEDDCLLVINKPSGLVVHPGAGHEQNTLVNALVNYTQELSMKNELRPGIVHRLDKETSGLLVVAKSDLAHDFLAKQFKNKTCHRIYYAVAEKEILKNAGTIQSYLVRHPINRKKYMSVKNNNKTITKKIATSETGRWAVTHFKKIATAALDRNLMLCYLQLQLETGRTHQIRVHLSESNHPLFGDLIYGASAVYYKKLNLSRFFLHAAELGFIHPITKKNLLFKVPWPTADQSLIKEFGFATNLPGM